MQNKFPSALRATLVGMPPTREPATDTDSLRAELSAARATIASLQRQLKLRIESVTVVCVAPTGDDEPTRRGKPYASTVRREPVTKAFDVPCMEVRDAG